MKTIVFTMILAMNAFCQTVATIPPVTAQATPFAGFAIGITTGLIVLFSVIFMTTNNELVQ